MVKKETRTERLFIESLFENSCQNIRLEKRKVTVHKLTGDASTRRYFRIAGHKKSYIACLCEPGETLADFSEVQDVLTKENVNVPLIFDRVEKSGYLLQEDLGDDTLLRKLSHVDNKEEELLLYKNSLEELIKIHSIDQSKYFDKSFTKRSFDQEKYKLEFEFSIKFFLESFLNVDIKESDRKAIVRSFKNMERKLSSEKFVLTHRDFHSRNIMCSNEKISVIDFQDARMGIPQYDLVSLLEDCYYNILRPNKIALKDHYWDNFLGPSRLQESKEHYLELYDLMTIQRMFKAIGSFCYIYKTRKDERYLKYIGYSFEKLRKKMSKFDDFKECRKIISGYYYEH